MSYEFLGGSLKLKGTSDKTIKKKKKSKKDNSSKIKSVSVTKADVIEQTSKETEYQDAQSKLDALKTKAELAYEKANEKRSQQRLLKKAELTHRERVENYNRQLDQLSEYNDVPKVSWTK